MYDTKKCKGCKKEIHPYGNHCDNCKRKRKITLIRTCVILGIVILLMGGSLGYIDFQYQLDKCDNLTSEESSYDFDFKLETNAQYNQHCYFLDNHPFALASNLLFGVLMGVTLILFIGLIIVFVNFSRM